MVPPDPGESPWLRGDDVNIPWRGGAPPEVTVAPRGVDLLGSRGRGRGDVRAEGAAANVAIGLVITVAVSEVAATR
ncbi:hypothetical protein FPZ12_008765 [Amycolatopsis acidicola]|uniref:Uncharacterized protein n=1 Tax=Amycolatopsis acidicola TaxID=2596893 RepID=A0A5N0VE02_9PSEU|nr:hypothetical protein [Amycolatopsis acidicola]KAA9163593.1 hypothetical protein FPZ12_008765 [Amycolatopsis acidicola]